MKYNSIADFFNEKSPDHIEEEVAKIIQMKDKLESKHIAGYLPYGLKIWVKDYLTGRLYYPELTTIPLTVTADKIGLDFFLETERKNVKPIFRPLSDIPLKVIKDNMTFNDLICFKDESYSLELNMLGNEILMCQNAYDSWEVDIRVDTIAELPFWIVNILIENHFDIYGLIEKGLAIDINTLNIAE